MKLAQKISLGAIVLLLVVNMFLLLDNPRITGFFMYNSEIKPPHNFINEEDIIVYDDRIVLEVEDYVLSRYSGSLSMIPVFNSSSNGVGIKPKSIDDLHVGDIITFREKDKLIAHRIIEKGTDEKGWFCITKGDRNNLSDGKVRFSQIESVLVAVIY